MPHFETENRLARPPEEVFDFFCRPANLLRVTPPDLHLELLEAPERLQLGSRIVLKMRRWGIPQRVVAEVTAFEPPVRFVDEQREGPFRKWVHSHLFTAAAGETRLLDRIEFEPPGGVLGSLLTRRLIERDLAKMFNHRWQKLREIFDGTGNDSAPH